jgi:hypothetical protein
VAYVETTETEPRANGTPEQAELKAIGDAGVDLVVAKLESGYRGTGKKVVKMPDRQKGYDVTVVNPDGNVDRYIEVKTKVGNWNLRGVWLSKAQFDHARDEQAAFTLAVVENVYELEATIYFVDDPASRVDRFCFDFGWAAAANLRTTVRGAPRRTTEPALDGLPDDVMRLCNAVVASGLPEPEEAFELAGGDVLVAAWPDVRIGIAADGTVALAEAGWIVRSVADWTTAELVDAVRSGS